MNIFRASSICRLLGIDDPDIIDDLVNDSALHLAGDRYDDHTMQIVSGLTDIRHISVSSASICSTIDLSHSTALEILDMSDCANLSKCPILPSSLKLLYLSHTKITELCTLPESLEGLTLVCCRDLCELYDLPDSIDRLQLSFSNISKIDRLPRHLKYLSIWNTPIAELPELPDSLVKIWCDEHYPVPDGWQLQHTPIRTCGAILIRI